MFVKHSSLIAAAAILATLGAGTVESQEVQPELAVAPGSTGCDPFTPVFALMNRMPVDGGCVGCHIGPEPAIGPYWGPDQVTVLETLVSSGVLQGGRTGKLASLLLEGIMPLGGRPWDDSELQILMDWLILYE